MASASSPGAGIAANAVLPGGEHIFVRLYVQGVRRMDRRLSDRQLPRAPIGGVTR